MAITKDGTRQCPLVAKVDFTYADLTSGTGSAAVELPVGAIVTGGRLIITTAFNSATSDAIEVGVSGDVDQYLASQDVKTAAGSWPLLVPGIAALATQTDILLEWTGSGTAPTAGVGMLVVEYIIDGRSDQVQHA